MGLFGTSGLKGFMGNPVTNLLSDVVLPGAQFLWAQSNIPDTPTPYQDRAGGMPWDQTSVPTRGSYRPTEEQAAFLRNRPGTTNRSGLLPGVEDIDLQTIGRGYYGDMFAAASELERYNQVLRGKAEDYAAANEEAKGQIQRGIAGSVAAGRMGERQIGQAFRGLDQTVRNAERDVAHGIEAVTDLVGGFLSSSRDMYRDAQNMRAEVLAEVRDNAAVRLAQAGQAVTMQTGQAMDNLAGQLRAQGADETRITNEVAKVAAHGSQLMGDMRFQIGAEENQRMANVEIAASKLVIDPAVAIVRATSDISGAAAGEIGAQFRNLANVRQSVAAARSGLATDAAQWRTANAINTANLRNMYGQYAVQGNVDLFNMLSNIHDPVLQLGPLFEGMMNFGEGLQREEYELALERFGILDATTTRLVNSIREGFDQAMQVAESRHTQSLQQHIASQNRSAGIASAAIQAAGSAVGGALSKPSAPSSGG